MSALESAGEEFSQGNVLSGVWTGTMGVFLGAVTDVVTVGGILEVDEATQMWSDVLTVASQQGQPGSLNTYQMQNMQRLLTKPDPVSPHSSATSHGNSSKSNIAASDTEIATAWGLQTFATPPARSCPPSAAGPATAAMHAR